MLYLFSIFIIVLLLVMWLVGFIIQHECTVQAQFEERTRREWDAMSEEDRLASGRENMYC